MYAEDRSWNLDLWQILMRSVKDIKKIGCGTFWPSSIDALFERFPEIVAPGTASRFSQWHGLAMVREPSPKNGT